MARNLFERNELMIKKIHNIRNKLFCDFAFAVCKLVKYGR